MAKRKRLTPAQTGYLEANSTGLETKSMGFPATAPPPIAQVTGESAASAALNELAGEMKRARAEGRMIQAVPLDRIEAHYLERDRIAAAGDDLTDLVDSIKARGQQTPIEIVELAADRFGLISGWRRVTALRLLHEQTGEDRFATAQAILRTPDTASDAYVAMVEENEIRLGLSYYERARVAAKAVEAGVYASEKEALQRLFSTASRPKRSKIKSFLVLYHAADDLLRFPNAIGERLGIALSREIEDTAETAAFLREMLTDSAPDTADDEVALLQEVLTCATQKQTLNSGLESNTSKTGKAAPKQTATASPPGNGPLEDLDAYMLIDGVAVRYGEDFLQLEGRGVSRAFRKRLFAWILGEQERIAEDIKEPEEQAP